MDFISLFSGAGGLDLGLEAAGMNCLLASDHDADSIETLKANQGFGLGDGRRAMADTPILQHDVRSLSGSEVLGRIGRRRGGVPILAGGPPCQSWSSGGLQLGFDDPRGRLVDEYLRIASEIDARWLVFENVRGLLTARGLDGVPGSALESVRRELLSCGWQTRVQLLNAADHGVAQRRVRLIILGYRVGDAPPLPRPTHGEDSVRPWVTLRHCLSRIERVRPDEIFRPSGKMALELRDVLAGSGVKSPGKAEATRPGGHWGYKQGAFIADLDRPARTVTASSQQDWVRDNDTGLRRLCPRECAAIQSFPARWQFVGKRVSQYRQIGNAVPPMLAAAIGATLIGHLAGEVEREATTWRELAPLPRRLQAAVRYTEREEAANGASRRRTSIRPPLASAAE